MPIDNLQEHNRRHTRRPPTPPSESIFLKTLRLSRDGFTLIHLSSQTIIDASDAWLDLTGVPRGEALGKSACELSIWNNTADYNRFLKVVDEPGELEIVYRHYASGATRSAVVVADRLDLAGESYSLVIWREPFERKQKAQATTAESNLEQLVAAAVSGGADFNSSLIAAQRVLCAATGWDYAEAWLPAIDGTCCVPGDAWYSIDASLRHFKRESENYYFAIGNGLPGHSLETKQPVWIENLTAKEDFRRQSQARAAGFKSSLSVPIITEGTVTAIIVFFSRETRPPAPELSKRISDALNAVGARLKQQLAEAERERLAEILEATPDLVGITDAEGRVIYQNAAARHLLGVNGNHAVVAPESRDSIEDSQSRQVNEVITSVAIPTAIRDGVWIGETFALDRENRSVPILQTVIAHKSKDGSVKFFSTVGRDISARKRAEAALDLSEKRFRSLIEKGTDIIAIHDRDGIIRYESPSIFRILGYKPEELIGKPVIDLIHPDERKAAKEIMRKVREMNGDGGSGPHSTIELKFLHKDGSWRIIECTCSNLLDDPAIAGIIFNGRDVTAQKELLLTLQTTVTELRALFEAMNDVILVIDGDGRYLKIAPTNPELLYKPRQEMLGKTVREIFPPAQADYFLKGIRQALTSRKTIRLEYNLNIDDRDLYFIAVVSPMTENSVIFIARDITERKLFEKRLQESQSQLSLAQRIARLGSWEWNLKTGEFILSDEGFDILGLKPQEFVPTPENLQKFVLPEDVELTSKMMRVLLEEKRAVQFDYHIIRADGEIRTVHTVRAPIFDEQGDVVRIVGTTQDITETLELENQLRQAQKMEAIGRLAGGIAHDFNNMLTAINGYSSLILRQLEADNPVRQKVEEIKKAGDRAALLTHQLLTFSRKQVLKPRVVNLNDTVSDIYQMLDRLIGEDIEFQTYLSPDLGQVEADPGQISQVIVNLVINARDAMPSGGKLMVETVNVFLSESYATHHLGAKAGYYVMLSVSDTGTGMTPEIQRRIFEPFFTTKEVGKGTGMGLPTVYGIIKQSGGYIRVYSEVDKGTTFKIYLPRVDKLINETGYLPANPGSTRLPSGSEKILLVEDEDSVRELTGQILEICGYQVMKASNGADALKICEAANCEIDLLIADLVMPQMSGQQLFERLSADRPDMRVLYISGYTSNAVVYHGILEDGTNFLQKPYSPELLAQKVRQILDETPSSAAAATSTSSAEQPE